MVSRDLMPGGSAAPGASLVHTGDPNAQNLVDEALAFGAHAIRRAELLWALAAARLDALPDGGSSPGGVAETDLAPLHAFDGDEQSASQPSVFAGCALTGANLTAATLATYVELAWTR
jgi:hypothetical protein